MRASTTNRRACAIAACLFVAVACGGQSEDEGSPGGVTTKDSGGGVGPFDSGGINPGDATVDPTTDAGKPPKPKAMGSPCSADADCAAGLTCHAQFPGGACTKDCAADADCAGKGGSVGACIDSLCFAACSTSADAGAPVDGGKPKAPCKNKAFECVSVPGKADPVCMPQGDGGGGDDDGGEADSSASD
jgi:hypothetical protein